ncbi:MAG: YHS domain protein, partial [Roseiarcus sp.]
MLNKRTFIAFATAVALPAGVAIVPAAAAGPDVNATITGLALRGYDPVAYFTNGKPIPGDYR